MRVIAGVCAFALAMTAVAVTVLVDWQLQDASRGPDCRTFSLHSRRPLGIARCGVLDGMTPGQVRALLGAPIEDDGHRWTYSDLEVTFERGRVDDVRAVVYGDWS